MNEQIARKLKLSENFTLWEFLRSQKAEELGLMGDQFDIGESEINHLRLLCVNVLEPLLITEEDGQDLQEFLL
jgi:UDP-2,3-diacylglucosamine pyrophosphatase LpxH